MYPSVGGSSNNQPWDQPQQKRPMSLFGDPSTFTSAANTQGSDYDSIMKQYTDLANSYSSNPLTSSPINPSTIQPRQPITSQPITSRPVDAQAPITSRPLSSSPISSGNPLSVNQINSNPLTDRSNVVFNSINPQTAKYEQSADVTKSLSDLSGLADTGGYSAADIQNIRDRDTSPIRSIYSSGQQELQRQRALSGGYSPNFNAVSASMARDEANQIGNTLVSANAGIAQNVASNRLAAAPMYAGYSGQANAAKTAADQRNADIVNQINEDNASRKTSTDEFNTSTNIGLDKYNRDTQIGLDTSNRDAKLGVDSANRNTQIGLDQTNRGNILDTIKGKASLYGTTPALANMFGNQVVQAGQLDQGQQDLNNRRLSTVASWGGRGWG